MIIQICLGMGWCCVKQWQMQQQNVLANLCEKIFSASFVPQPPENYTYMPSSLKDTMFPYVAVEVENDFMRVSYEHAYYKNTFYMCSGFFLLFLTDDYCKATFYLNGRTLYKSRDHLSAHQTSRNFNSLLMLK